MFQVSSARQNTRDSLNDTPDLSTSRLHTDLVLFLPGVSASLLTFVVFGTTKTFRDYLVEKLVPGRVRSVRRRGGKQAPSSSPRRSGMAQTNRSVAAPLPPRLSLDTYVENDLGLYTPTDEGSGIQLRELNADGSSKAEDDDQSPLVPELGKPERVYLYSKKSCSTSLSVSAFAMSVAAHYNDGNRAFLQAFLARGALTFGDAQHILAEIFTLEAEGGESVRPQDVTGEDFDSYLAAAAEAVSFFDYEIRSHLHQATKQRTHALVNTASDPMTQLATTYNAEQIAFTKRLLDAMFELYNSPRMEIMAITEMQAVKLARPPRPNNADANGGDPAQTQSAAADRGLKHSEVEDMMVKLVNQGWLEKSEDAFFSLAPRALMELRAWLVESYNDPDAAREAWQPVKFCEACKEMVTIGQRCGERDCNARLHDTCGDAYWRTQRSRKCPRCSRDWDGEHFVGEKAVTSTEAYQRGRRRSGPSASRRNGADADADQSVQRDDEEGDEVNGEGEGEGEDE
ncbi:Non-structural maintenance of chromosomes element 1-like protein, partial [Colletotrichum trifolii]